MLELEHIFQLYRKRISSAVRAGLIATPSVCDSSSLTPQRLGLGLGKRRLERVECVDRLVYCATMSETGFLGRAMRGRMRRLS